MSREILIQITTEEHLRMKAIQLDDDKSEALAMIKLLLSRIEAKEHKSMKSPWDISRNGGL